MKNSNALLNHLPLPIEDRLEMSEFCALKANRFAVLTESLRRREINYDVIPIGEARHIALVAPETAAMDGEYYRVTLLAHYDRVEGTPGANDNAAAVFQLLSHWEDIRQLGWRHRTQILFTDKEELSAGMSATDQGSWQLARRLKELGTDNLLFFVLDMCGIGDTPIWGCSASRSPQTPEEAAALRAHQVMESFLKQFTHGRNYGVHPRFSDDLGLLLGGYPAIRLSLLPRSEVELLVRQTAESSTEYNSAQRRTGQDLPASWQTNHGPHDCVSRLNGSSFQLMLRLLRHLARYRFPLY